MTYHIIIKKKKSGEGLSFILKSEGPKYLLMFVLNTINCICRRGVNLFIEFAKWHGASLTCDLVIYCCITRVPKPNGLKTRIFIIPRSICGAGIWKQLGYIFWLRRIRTSSQKGYSHLKEDLIASSHGCWQEFLVLLRLLGKVLRSLPPGLFRGLLCSMMTVFLQLSG